MDKLKKVLVFDNISIKESLKKMDQSAEKILIIVYKNRKLKGIITDGDIRRWILKGGSLDQKIDKVMNKNPIFLRRGFQKKQIQDLMIKHKIECVPILDENDIVLSAVWWVDVFENRFEREEKIDTPVVIMAGGKGTRLHPFTKILPKPLIPIHDRPIIEIILDRFYKFGCQNFYISVNYRANMIKAYFNDISHDYHVKYIQEEKPLGTAGSLYLLLNKIKKTFFLINCDILIEADYADILKFHKKNKNKITIIASLKHYLIPYGIIKMKKGGILNNIQEKPEFDFYVNTGMYVCEPEVLKDIPKNKFFLMTDLINLYLKKGKKVGAYPVSEKSWIDIGQWEELQEAVDRIGIT